MVPGCLKFAFFDEVMFWELLIAYRFTTKRNLSYKTWPKALEQALTVLDSLPLGF